MPPILLLLTSPYILLKDDTDLNIQTTIPIKADTQKGHLPETLMKMYQ